MAVEKNLRVTRNFYKKLTMAYSYYMVIKIFIEANCWNNKHAGENVFCICYFSRFVSRFFPDRANKL